MNNNPFIPDIKFELIPIKDLVSDQKYQRNLSMKHVKEAAKNFDINQINPVKVSRRNGVNYVFNGQHTMEIIATVSGSRDTPVWCMIYENLDYEEEADIFANQQKYAKALKTYEIFMANVEAGNTKELIIKDLLESYGLTLSLYNGPGRVVAVGTLERIFDQYGLENLDRTIRLIVSTWEGDSKSFSSNMIMGIARLVYVYGETLDNASFKEKLSVVPLSQLARTARERSAGSLGYSEAIVNIYNKKRPVHKCLPLQFLYRRSI